MFVTVSLPRLVLYRRHADFVGIIRPGFREGRLGGTSDRRRFYEAPTAGPSGSPDSGAFERSRPRGGRYAWLKVVAAG